MSTRERGRAPYFTDWLAAVRISGIHQIDRPVADTRKITLTSSQKNWDCSTKANELFGLAEYSERSFTPRVRRRRTFSRAFAAAFLACTALLLASCGDDPTPKVAEEAAKPPEPAVPEDIQAAAVSLLGKETKVLLMGDLAKTGTQQFLAANVIPKTPKNENLSGTIITRAVLAENRDGQWNELFRCDEHLKNAKGFMALTPLTSVAGWRIQYDQDPIKGLQLYLTPIQGVAVDSHLKPIGVAWNPAVKRYQSLDMTYEHFLGESPSLETARSRLK